MRQSVLLVCTLQKYRSWASETGRNLIGPWVTIYTYILPTSSSFSHSSFTLEAVGMLWMSWFLGRLTVTRFPVHLRTKGEFFDSNEKRPRPNARRFERLLQLIYLTVNESIRDTKQSFYFLWAYINTMVRSRYERTGTTRNE